MKRGGEGSDIDNKNRSPHQNRKRVTIYIDRTLIEDDRDTIGREVDTIHVKNNKSVILDI